MRNWMRIGPLGWLAIILWLGTASGLAAEIAVANATFEEVLPSGEAAAWQRIDDAAPGNSVGLDGDIFRDGEHSLRVSHVAPDRTVIQTEPVTLQVGHLYRLRAWVRTDEAFADPTSHFPTAVPACLTMASFPFTNHSPALGATRDWTELQVLFIATHQEDRIRLHLGLNGTATGTAWFDDVSLEKVEDITQFIAPETVRRFGPAYRYDDRGWIFVHIEGEPYVRGYQLGRLLSEEIVAYMSKLAIQKNSHDPAAGWRDIRFMTEAMMLRKYDEEFQFEMKGIADGAAAAGAQYDDRPVDFVDIVCLNSVIDLGQMEDALPHTASAVSGINFLKTEDELLTSINNHKCSAVVATDSATTDGRFVFGQIFMWYGYTGVHWNVICDVQPAQGHRFVHQTFPGGIHSGADFYINEAGLVIGETTVRQTPYNQDGTPQSNRIRKAVQYADTIDDVVRIMTTANNGQYTNEWPFADAQTGEIGIFLLGTDRHRLWRSSQKDFPGGLTDFYWCNNNNKDPRVREEYVVNPDNAPYDLVFRPWNRDLAFNEFYRTHQGRIDTTAVVNLWASSPVNRAHACDGKITSAEMAEQLVFLAHHGKLTLRHKMTDSRWIPDLPGATPHLSLGYSVPSPLWVTPKLQALPDAGEEHDHAAATGRDLAEVDEVYTVDTRQLWRNTVYPASAAENWLVSGSAAYWRMLNDLPDDPAAAADTLGDQLAELNCRYLYTVSREGGLAPAQAELRYDRYKDYEIPRIKGTFALHQLRLLLGNDVFLKVMDEVYTEFAGRELTTDPFIARAATLSGRDLGPFVAQWLERDGLPDPLVSVLVEARGENDFVVRLDVTQLGEAYHLVGMVDIRGEEKTYRRRVELDGTETLLELPVPEFPREIVFNAGNDFPVPRERFYTLANFIDDFHHTLIVYGTARQVEANHSLARRWQETVADAYVEILPPLRKDCEITDEEMRTHDLMVLGEAADHTLLDRLRGEIRGLEFGRGWFRWLGELYARPDDGLVLVVPNPWNEQKVLYLFLSNSALQLYHMTTEWKRNIPSWAVYRADEIVGQGYHEVGAFTFTGGDGHDH